MKEQKRRFELSANIDHYLAALSKLYAKDRERLKQEIIVNSQVRVTEEWSYDNWNGGTYGHAIYLTVPEVLYLSIAKKKEDIQKQIKKDLNQLHNVQNEFIEEVFLEMEPTADRDWRRDSGVLSSRQRVVTPTSEQRIWGEKGFRVFLSHKAEVKKETAELKEQLEAFGMACFVAHADIHPTREWQDEIENALASMDAFVALLTKDFHKSDWTDQEVGYALGRNVPLIAVKLERDPYGFMAKFQALTCDWNKAPLALVKLLIKDSRMLEAYLAAVSNCSSFEEGNALAEILPSITKLTNQQVAELIAAFNKNSQLQGSYGFSGKWSSRFGSGLASHLTRITGEGYVRSSDDEIKKTRKK